MTPELRMAQMLSSDDEKQKIANDVTQLSIEELGTLIKESGVGQAAKDAVQHVARNRGKYGLGVGAATGYASGRSAESIQRDSYYDPKKDKWLDKKDKDWDRKGNPKTMKAVKYASEQKTAMPKEDLDEETLQRVTATAKAMRAEAKKTPSMEEKIAMADSWGRELAKQANGDMLQYYQDNPDKLKEKQKRDAKKEKKAGVFRDADNASKFVGRISRLWEKHGPAVKNMAGKAGKGAQNTVKGIGERIGKIENPISRGAAAGATIGGVAGGIQGLISPDRDPYTGEKKRLKTMLTKGTAGALTGAATGALTGSMHKSSSVQRLEAAMTKRAAGIIGGGSLGTIAKNFVASAKPLASKAIGGATMGRAVGTGAAAGGAMGAIKGFVAPGRDAQGNTKSRIGGALKGGASGALGGAAVGAATKGIHSKMTMPAVAPASPTKFLQRG